MNKELYIKPQFDIFEVELETPIASSVTVTNSNIVVYKTWEDDNDVTEDINWY